MGISVNLVMPSYYWPYDRAPSFKYRTVGEIAVSEVGSYEDENGEMITRFEAEHTCSYAINGALWIDYLQAITEGNNWTFIENGEQYGQPWKAIRDGGTEYIRLLRYSSNHNMHHTVYTKIVTRSGATLYSNSLVYSGTPEKPTVTIIDTRTSSVNENQCSKVLNSNADIKSYGYCDGMAISDIEINKNKVVTIDALKEIPMNRIMH